MQIETTRFGRIEIDEESVIHFPRGLYGLNGARRYCLLPGDSQGNFFWLQAADEPAIAMVVTDPFLSFPGYEVIIPDAAAEVLQAAETTDVAVYASITVAPERDGVFANLLGPLVINHRTRVGMQLIQDSDRYSTRHRLNPQPASGEAAGGAERIVEEVTGQSC